MNLRHAAALALVGWYLMAPPMTTTGPFFQPNKKAPISEWDRQGQYNSSSDCQAALKEYLDYPPISIRKYKDSLVAECISTDDPPPQGKVE